MKQTGHITTVKADKTLLADVPCLCIGSVKTLGGQQITSREVFFYPDEVFLGKCEKKGRRIFFVPVLPFNGVKQLERVPVPIFMLDFYPHHRKEIITYGKVIKGYKIKEKDFHKPQIAITEEELVEEFELN